jgi:hypothetical protein
MEYFERNYSEGPLQIIHGAFYNLHFQIVSASSLIDIFTGCKSSLE